MFCHNVLTYLDGRGYRSAQELDRLMHHDMQAKRYTLGLAFTAKGENLSYQVFGASAGRDDLLQVVAGNAIGGQLLQGQFTKA
jgi:hypothetical protein